ncbi:MAG: mechanosensitive ion channel family protein [Akkermansiaceae bacterium]|nr:mechanosensitive ion channel family protein [Akkermansiaceae bacterium]
MLAVSGTRELGDFGDLLKALVPSGGALVAVIALLIGLRFALGRARSSPTKNFRIQVIMLIATLVGVVLVALALPPEDAIRDHGIRLLGIVISATIALSSTTILGNALAGVQLRSVSAFKPGDFLGIGDHFGRVSERGLFHTEIQTEDARPDHPAEPLPGQSPVQGRECVRDHHIRDGVARLRCAPPTGRREPHRGRRTARPGEPFRAGPRAW